MSVLLAFLAHMKAKASLTRLVVGDHICIRCANHISQYHHHSHQLGATSKDSSKQSCSGGGRSDDDGGSGGNGGS
ncbi:hypothetical protein PIB30_062064 [Stylosanthes scabra]|uniref:Uncharacterized protein n=1 Tax=Stylosanthes scabra TaxID=79078 RepID=A0ABU6TNF1_9FABA|nr:hypothetical protein [Stylosanthes scabra]